MGAPFLFSITQFKRGDDYDLPDNADKYRSGGRTDVAS